MGKRENPYPYLKKADYFVLLSKFEGYGMVIDEAKILNKNIIITKTAAIEAVKGYARKLILENTEDNDKYLLEVIFYKDTSKDFEQNKFNLYKEIFRTPNYIHSNKIDEELSSCKISNFFFDYRYYSVFERTVSFSISYFDNFC